MNVQTFHDVYDVPYSKKKDVQCVCEVLSGLLVNMKGRYIFSLTFLP